jgi:hypothetical protein
LLVVKVLTVAAHPKTALLNNFFRRMLVPRQQLSILIHSLSKKGTVATSKACGLFRLDFGLVQVPALVLKKLFTKKEFAKGF